MRFPGAEILRNSGRICATSGPHTVISCKQFCLQERIVVGWQLNLQFSAAKPLFTCIAGRPDPVLRKADRPRSSLAPCRMLP